MIMCIASEQHPEWQISWSITGIADEEAEQSYRALDIA